MIKTAVDTSILIDLLDADEKYGEASKRLFIQCVEQGIVVACEVVWAEVRPQFESSNEQLSVFEDIGLLFDPLNQEAAIKAGETMKDYRARGGKHERMIPDFLIASHALKQCDRLLTRDRGFYRNYFSKLKLV